MRLNKIPLKQLKKDLGKLYTKRKSRFGEDSPLQVTGQKVELKKKPTLKERLNKIPLKKIGTGLAVVGGVAAAAAGAHHVATKTEAGKTVTSAISARVGYEKGKALEKVDKVKQEAEHRVAAAKAQAEREHQQAMNNLNKAIDQRAQVVGRDVANAAGDFHRAVGDVQAAGHELKGKALEEWNKSNVSTKAANNLASWIAPPGQKFGRTRFGQNRFGRNRFGNKFKELVKKHKKSLITAGKVAAVVGTTAAVAGAGAYAHKKRKESLAYEASPEGQEAKRKKLEDSERAAAEVKKAAEDAEKLRKVQEIVDRRKSRLAVKEQGKAILANERLIAQNEAELGIRSNQPLTKEGYQGKTGDIREKTKLYNELKQNMKKQELEYKQKLQELQIKLTNLTTVYNNLLQTKQHEIYQKGYRDEQKHIEQEKNKRLAAVEPGVFATMKKNGITAEYNELNGLNKTLEQRRINAGNNAVTAWITPIKAKLDDNIDRINNEINILNERFNEKLIEDKNKLKQYSQFGKLRFGKRRRM